VVPFSSDDNDPISGADVSRGGAGACEKAVQQRPTEGLLGNTNGAAVGLLTG